MDSPGVGPAYAAAADLYIDLFASGEHEHDDDLALIRSGLTNRPGLVVDLGCGPGHLSGFLAAQGAHVLGVDLVPEFVDYARNTHPDVEFRLGSMTRLDLPDASASGALCWYSLVHFGPDEVDAVLREVRRVLQPGATLVIGFFVGDAIEPFDHKVWTAYRWPTDELLQRLGLAGFTEAERLEREASGATRRHGAIAVRAV